MESLNKKIFFKIYNKRNRILSIASWFFSNGSFLVLFFLCWAIFFVTKSQNFDLLVKFFLNVSFSIVLVKFIVDGIIKKFYFKPRPYVIVEKIEGIGKKENNSTLPSGHVTMVTAVVLTFIFYSPAFIFLLLTIPLVMWSRIYNGMHWPLDVLVGLFLGAFIANIIYTITSIVF